MMPTVPGGTGPKEKVEPKTASPEVWDSHGTVPPPMTPEFGVAEIPTVESQVSPETKDEKSLIPVLDRKLIKMGTESPERKAAFVRERSELSPDAMVDLYHGLNGGLRAALGVLESPDRGVRQISGPALSLYPVGQFWKPGDAGFHYSVPRRLIAFPGENNPDAKIRVDEGGTAWIEGDVKALPVDEYSGEVLRTERKEDVYEEQVIGGVREEVLVGERVVELTDAEKEEAAKVASKLADLKATKG